ncbi:hypothetical protein [Streptomyces candidus]|uniref:Uncharacterized protein n=1 Tax=Streptomyces candidus TaxID=67283 RepID=A0A7X0HLI0_9ACTN|nr:hypothetical protein [Streptomyces candidus]MBB6439885.1 hypothetical protein [Streptomyces candidus]GHH58006.1 hypothetical protein GCM10018773_65960 [Streptomyces candidus]
MSIWALLEAFEWAAITGALFLTACGLWVTYQLARRLHRWLAGLLYRTWARLQGSPLVDAEPIGEDIPDGYHDPEGLAEMRHLARLVELNPRIDTTPGLRNDAWLDLEELYRLPAKTRTEENQ